MQIFCHFIALVFGVYSNYRRLKKRLPSPRDRRRASCTFFPGRFLARLLGSLTPGNYLVNVPTFFVESFSVPALLEKLVWHYDEPFADATCMSTSPVPAKRLWHADLAAPEF
jgi:hypothetical protein